MKIFAFPELVQIEILKTMGLGELFLLSFASKETRKSIKHLYPKNRWEIAIEVDEDGTASLKTGNRTVMVIKTQMNTCSCEERLAMLNSGQLHILVRFSRFGFINVYSDAEDSASKIHKYFSDLTNSKSSVFTTVHSAESNESYNCMHPSFYANGYNKRHLEQLIQKGISDIPEKVRYEQRSKFRYIFRRDPRDEGEFEKFLERGRVAQKHWLQCREHSAYLVVDDSLGKSRVEKAICLGKGNRAALEIFFKVFPDLKFCMIDLPNPPSGFLSSCRSMNHVDDLIMRTVGIAFTMLLISFRGQNILLEKCHLRLEWPNLYDKLVEMWKTGKRDNLKTFIAYQDPGVDFDPEPYLEVFGDQTWDPKQRPRFYPYESIITDYHKFPADTFDCEDGVDIVRDSDGRRATVKMTRHHFMFFVWPESRADTSV